MKKSSNQVVLLAAKTAADAVTIKRDVRRVRVLLGNGSGTYHCDNADINELAVLVLLV